MYIMLSFYLSTRLQPDLRLSPTPTPTPLTNPAMCTPPKYRLRLSKTDTFTFGFSCSNPAQFRGAEWFH